MNLTLKSFFLTIILFHFPIAGLSKPFIPLNDSEILEKLTVNVGSTKELKKLKKSLEKDPKNITLVIETTKHLIKIGREESDPRYFGYAESIIKPFLNIEKPNAEILVLNATIKQYNHNFKDALKDLDLAISIDSENPQAWASKSAINTTIGNYNNAKQSCIPLLRLTGELSTIACISYPGSLSGSAEKSYKTLVDILNKTDGISLDERVSALSLIAEIAVRLGKKNDAENHYKEALKLNPHDVYLLTSYSDFLLSQSRTKEVISLLQDKTRADGLLLRLAIAEKKIKSPLAQNHINELKERFKAIYKRGNSIHLREEAIFNLKLLNDPKKALELSSENWESQKEPVDAQILLESAVAVKDKNSAKAVIDFISKNKTEDVNLTKLIEELKNQ